MVLSWSGDLPLKPTVALESLNLLSNKILSLSLSRPALNIHLHEAFCFTKGQDKTTCYHYKYYYSEKFKLQGVWSERSNAVWLLSTLPLNLLRLRYTMLCSGVPLRATILFYEGKQMRASAQSVEQHLVVWLLRHGRLCTCDYYFINSVFLLFRNAFFTIPYIRHLRT